MSNNNHIYMTQKYLFQFKINYGFAHFKILI